MEHLSLSQRSVLIGTGIVRARKEQISVVAKEHMANIEGEEQNFGAMLQIDNYNKLRFSSNPNEERDRTINGCAAACFPINCTLNFDRWKSPAQLS